ncbi:MAG: hypothetical protein PHD46_04250 [Eubacteriales bacterium]|nr:hypothetical protein [Eubacteriales bacterium]
MWKPEKEPTANLRQSSRIAFSLRSGALLRLIAYAGIAPSLEKCYGKNPRAGFSYIVVLFFFDSGCGAATPARSGPRWRYPNFRDVIKSVGYLVDLKPESGKAGDEIIAEGTPDEVVKVERMYTGQLC